MKSYLSLIPISAHVHRRQNRLTLLCITISVFLVTAVFSMADMGNRMQTNNMLKKHGNWHIQLKNVPEADAEQIGQSADVSVAAWTDVVNYGREEEYHIGKRKAVLYGIDEAYITDIKNGLKEGSFPQNDTEILLSSNAKDAFGAKTGDRITIETPSGSMDFTISGFGEDDEEFNALYGTFSVYMNRKAFEKYGFVRNPSLYIRYQSQADISRHVSDIKEEYGWTDENIEVNKALMGTGALGGDSGMQEIYMIAVMLFILILIAGALMIAGSMNSNVAQRTKFFGMMRCIGMSREQIIRFVRLEALNWCKIAIPAGVILGILVTWGVCALLRFMAGEEFVSIPLFGVSAAGIVSGVAVGIITVLIAAQSPAKRASRVSPVSAVTGNAGDGKNMSSAANTRFAKIETALGMHHAVSKKKNLILMTGSFALSIILFLSFTVFADLVGLIMPQKSNDADIEIASSDGSNSISSVLLDELGGMEGVTNVFGRRSCFDVPAQFAEESLSSGVVDVISYDEFDLDCLTKDKELKKGSDISKVYGNSRYVLAICDADVPVGIGDKIRVGSEEVEIAGMLKMNPFSSDGTSDGKVTIITSKETFTRLMGIAEYALIMVQVEKDVENGDVEAIRNAADNEIDGEYAFRNRIGQKTGNTYAAFMIFAYGFLAIIALVTVLNIVNSISMSVSARIRQYGTMRAVGMDEWQVTKMIAAEAFTYAFYGCVAGCILGLLLSKGLYGILITPHFPYAVWSIPIVPLLVIVLLVFAAAVAAVYSPAKRIRSMAVTETMNEL